MASLFDSIANACSAELNALDMSRMSKYIAWHPFHIYFDMPAGKAEFRVPAFASTLLGPRDYVVDLGTGCSGMDAAAFALNPDVRVHTYDVREQVPRDSTFITIRDVPNISVHAKMSELSDAVLLGAKIVQLNIHPHTGQFERDMLERLRTIGFSGVVLIQCIGLQRDGDMASMWNSITERKLDITSIGHWAGTGIVDFGGVVASACCCFPFGNYKVTAF